MSEQQLASKRFISNSALKYRIFAKSIQGPEKHTQTSTAIEETQHKLGLVRAIIHPSNLQVKLYMDG
jgi:hypothetical protein